MKKRAVILIDGENFRYSLKSLFPARFKYLPKKVDWPKLFTLPLAEDHELVRIYWYVVDSLRFSFAVIAPTYKELDDPRLQIAMGVVAYHSEHKQLNISCIFFLYLIGLP